MNRINGDSPNIVIFEGLDLKGRFKGGDALKIKEQPWDNEPDEMTFWFEAPSLVRAKTHRNNRIDKKYLKQFGFVKKQVKMHGAIYRVDFSGTLNGYVGVPNHHVSFYNKNIEDELECPGGVTFANYGGRTYAPTLNHYFYYGFDTAHAHDIWPKVEYTHDMPGATYKDINYVEKAIYHMMDQLLHMQYEGRVKINPSGQSRN